MSDQRGAASLELALGFALILVPCMLLALSFGPWLERRSFARLAVAETARAVIVGEGGEVAAAARVAEMAANNGIDPASVTLSFCFGPPAPVTGPPASTCGPLERGGRVAATVGVEVPVLRLPFRRATGEWVELGGILVEASHVEAVDLYRSLP